MQTLTHVQYYFPHFHMNLEQVQFLFFFVFPQLGIGLHIVGDPSAFSEWMNV